MAGSASVPNVFAAQGGNVPASQLDANWNALRDYLNVREIGFGLLTSRPAAGTHGNWWYATDTQQLFADDGTAWILVEKALVESFTKAGLPAAGTPGHLVRVTDSVRGVWMDQGTQWFGLSGEVINVREFGAVGDGVADDTSAIQAAITAVSAAGGVVLLPAGTYKVTSTLTSTASKLAIVGVGHYQSVISGNFATTDIIKLGSDVTAPVNLLLRNFRVTSSVAKISGAGIHLRRVSRSVVDNVVLDGQDGNGNLFIGIWFDAVDSVVYRGVDVKASSIGIDVNGQIGANPKSDLRVSDGRILGGTVGLRIGGAFGGFMSNSLDISSATTGISINNATVAEANREIFIGPETDIDSCTGVGVSVNDTLATNSTLVFSSVWAASNGSHGIQIVAWGGSHVNVVGGNLFNNTGDGIRIDAGTTVVLVSGVHVRNNGGIGINNTVAGLNTTVTLGSNRYASNTGGHVGGSFAATPRIISLLLGNYGTTVAAGGTGFLTTAAIVSTPVSVNSPIKCVIRNLRAASTLAPGVGQTFTYTVQKNGVDGIITCTTSGTGINSSDTTNEVAYALGDGFDVKIVNSAGGAVAGHAAVVDLMEIP